MSNILCGKLNLVSCIKVDNWRMSMKIWRNDSSILSLGFIYIILLFKGFMSMSCTTNWLLLCLSGELYKYASSLIRVVMMLDHGSCVRSQGVQSIVYVVNLIEFFCQNCNVVNTKTTGSGKRLHIAIFLRALSQHRHFLKSQCMDHYIT